MYAAYCCAAVLFRPVSAVLTFQQIYPHIGPAVFALEFRTVTYLIMLQQPGEDGIVFQFAFAYLRNMRINKSNNIPIIHCFNSGLSFIRKIAYYFFVFIRDDLCIVIPFPFIFFIHH